MDKIIEFFREVGKLKTLKRTGWVVEGVQDPESIADHSFRTALAVIILGKHKQDIDLFKCVKMALAHDIAESQIGDLLVDWKLDAHGEEKLKNLKDREKHGITLEEKIKREKEGMKKLTSVLGEEGKELLELWEEFEECKTKESVFVKSVENFEMFLQAYEYEESQQGVDISSWFNHGNNWRAKDQEINSLIKIIVEKRKARQP